MHMCKFGQIFQKVGGILSSRRKYYAQGGMKDLKMYIGRTSTLSDNNKKHATDDDADVKPRNQKTSK